MALSTASTAEEAHITPMHGVGGPADSHFDLQPVKAQDIVELAEIESSAMLPVTMNSCCFLPTVSADEQREFFHTILQHRWEGAVSGTTDTFFLKAVDSRGSIEGFVVWSLRHGGQESGNLNPNAVSGGTKVKAISGGTGVKAVSDTPQTRTIERHDPRLRPEVQQWRREGDAMNQRCASQFRRYVYIDKMYVRPRSQRHGIGSALLKEGPVAHARKLSSESASDGVAMESRTALPIMVQSLGGARAFYQSRGMEMVDKFVVDLEAIVGQGAGFGNFWFSNLVLEHLPSE